MEMEHGGWPRDPNLKGLKLARITRVIGVIGEVRGARVGKIPFDAPRPTSRRPPGPAENQLA